MGTIARLQRNVCKRLRHASGINRRERPQRAPHENGAEGRRARRRRQHAPRRAASVAFEAARASLRSSAVDDGVGSTTSAASSRLSQAPIGQGADSGFPIA